MADLEYIPSAESLTARFDEIGRKFWSLWIFALLLFLSYRWFGSAILAVLTTFLLLVLLWKVVIASIALWTLYGRVEGFSQAVRNNLILAYFNLFLVAYSTVGIWMEFPLVWVALLLASVVSALNLVGGSKS